MPAGIGLWNKVRVDGVAVPSVGSQIVEMRKSSLQFNLRFRHSSTSGGSKALDEKPYWIYAQKTGKCFTLEWSAGAEGKRLLGQWSRRNDPAANLFSSRPHSPRLVYNGTASAV